MKKTIEDIQQVLKTAGYYKGLIDGDFGKNSRAALDAAITAANTLSTSAPTLSAPVRTTSFNQTSLDRLKGVDQRLVKIVHRAHQIATVDFMVVEGLRTLERQKQLYAQGRTTKGKIVTWTLKSKHLDGLAVDLAPIKNGQIDWTDLPKFDAVAKAMFAAAAELGVKIRWGADWNQNGRPREKGEHDSPHFELV
ncbi:MAG: M15 family metallopeptidase [Pseudomonadota bacterium]|nr:M15 family metallopeptidase [Pseudomonadota bacterium]